MKNYLSIILFLVCAGLALALMMTKHGDNAQRDTDASAITDFSNRLDSAETQFHLANGSALVFSNSLNECRAALLLGSNQLTDAQSTIARGTEQITNLDRQLTDTKAENQTLGQRAAELANQMTNQMASLTKQLMATQASLVQATNDLVQVRKDFALLENRFRIDVAERTVVERQFNNLQELQLQMQKLKKHAPVMPTPESIYAGLNVEVNSKGGFHVISPE